MLILTRKPGESLYIGDDVKVTIVEIKGNQIRVGIDAPADLRIYREEIYRQILEENKSAAEGVMASSALDELSGGWKGVSKGGAEAKLPRGSKAQPMRPAAPAMQPPVFVKRKKKRFEDEEEEKDEGKQASSKENGQES
jgi:carbon storage regulator